MSILLICEKPMMADFYRSCLNKDDRIIVAPSINSYKFKVDENLKYSNVPYYNEKVCYKDNLDSYIKYFCNAIFDKNGLIKNTIINKYINSKFVLKNNDYLEMKEELISFFNSFDQIISLCDFNHRGLRAVEQMFSLTYEIEDFNKILNEVKYISNIDLLNKEGLNERIKINIDNEKIDKIRNEYLNKDFFDYNYNLNSLMLLSPIYKMIFNEKPKYLLTSNLIQILFILREQSFNINDFLKILEKKYIGSLASRNELINNSKEMNLVDIEKNNIKLSEDGSLFLNMLHRKMNDPHLSERILKDRKTLNPEGFILKYNKYLRTVFIKQKRQLNKIMS